MRAFSGVQLRTPVVQRAAPVCAVRQMVEGKVTSEGMNKTITVEVSRYRVDARYGKRVKLTKKYHAHDELNEAEAGDTVQLVSGRKLSKTKSFALAKIIRKVVKL